MKEGQIMDNLSLKIYTDQYFTCLIQQSSWERENQPDSNCLR